MRFTSFISNNSFKKKLTYMDFFKILRKLVFIFYFFKQYFFTIILKLTLKLHKLISVLKINLKIEINVNKYGFKKLKN